MTKREPFPERTHATAVAVKSPGAAPAASPPSVPKTQARPTRAGSVELPLILAVVGALLVYAFMRRNEGDLTAETGLGYWLGIVGGSMMLLLLAYPLRKRLRALAVLGGIRGWFRLHMILGIVGPTAIILHSNFKLGSLNSTAALLSMIVVAGSGLIGRFLYARIHRGLYGKKETLRARMDEIETVRDRWSDEINPELTEVLKQYQARRLDGVAGFWRSFSNTLTGPFSRMFLRRRLLREVRAARRKAGAATFELGRFDTALNSYLLTMGRAEAFRFYERAFAAWHLFHLPLFIILVFAAMAHVLAVHLY